MSDIEEYLKAFVRVLPKEAAKFTKGQVLTEIAPFISENFINAQNRSYILQESGRSYKYTPRTDSDPRLYVNSGALEKAVTVPNAEGNASEVVMDGGKLQVKVTVDLDVVPYARVHELGGETGSKKGRFTLPPRPYVAPALEAFQNAPENGFAAFVREMMETIAAVVEKK